jgi:3-oxoacyl-[acyl-carrier-protein] synthase II
VLRDVNARIAIRGTELVTPLGVGVKANWRRLLAGESRTGRLDEVDLKSEISNLKSGISDLKSEMPDSSSRVHVLASLAAAEALHAAPTLRAALADDRTALVVATSRGPADDWISISITATASAPSFGLSSVADYLARFIGHGCGPRLTLSGACASGLHALIRAALLIEHGDADRALVVGAESSLHPMFVESFRRLGVLAPPGQRCRPFDVNRCGFLCSEAAAAVVLERIADSDLQSGDLYLDRFAFAGDAGHLTGFDPAGATLRRVLAHVVDGRPVDVIHAHGTGTEANDAAEAAAIDAVLSEVPRAVSSDGSTRRMPSVYSHKGAIGHTVGAAGLVSVVLNAQMHRHGVVPPNAGLQMPIELRQGELRADAVEREVRRSVASAAGFGGAVAAVSLIGAYAEVDATG